MAHQYVPIPVQTITPKQVEKIAKFLKKQPRWHYPQPGEYEEGKRFKTKPGVEQHWLWQEENQATSWDDFIMEWGNSNNPHYIKTDRAHLIMPGELFMCDFVGGELWIGRLKHKNSRSKGYEVLYQVSDNMVRDYGNNFNGYAILPKI